MDVIELKRTYRNHLDVIKSTTSTVAEKSTAMEGLSIVYNSIKKMEPDTKIETPEEILEKFFNDPIPDVVYGEIPKDKQEYVNLEIAALEVIRLEAAQWVRITNPKLDDQTDKFGQIVNARMQLIIAYRS